MKDRPRRRSVEEPASAQLAVRALRAAWDGSPRLSCFYMFVTIAAALLPLASAWGLKGLLDALPSTVGRPGDAPLPAGAGAALAALSVALLIPQALTPLKEMWGAELSRAMSFKARDQMARKLTSLKGLRTFEVPEFHDELRLAQQGGESAPFQVLGLIALLLQSAVTAVTLVLALAVVSVPVSALLVAAAIPGLVLETRIASRRVRLARMMSPRDRRAFFYTLLQSDLRAAKEIRTFGLGDHFRHLMLRDLRTVHDGERRLDVSICRHHLLLGFAGATVFLLVVVGAFLGAVRGRYTAGEVSLLLTAGTGVQGACLAGVGSVAQLTDALLRYRYFVRFTDREPEMPTVPGALPARALTDGVRFDNVWFRYSEDHPWLLKGLDLEVPAGGSIAIVGANGAGKSTLVKLLCRFYDPVRGAVSWDGVPYPRLNIDQLRARITVVFQDFMEYELTAAHNIGVGKVSAVQDRARVAAAARVAGVAGDIERLPRGFDTMLTRIFIDLPDEPDEAAAPDLGEASDGVQLSGGQWQKVAIARACMRQDSDLLILDEPSSSLDADAEHELLAKLKSLMDGRSTIVISHRLSTAKLADKIVVIEDGRVAEEGTHDQLVSFDGTYARMYSLQSASYA